MHAYKRQNILNIGWIALNDELFSLEYWKLYFYYPGMQVDTCFLGILTFSNYAIPTWSDYAVNQIYTHAQAKLERNLEKLERILWKC